MMIEQNTNYAYKIKYMGNPTFDKVRELSAKFYIELPQELKDELYEALHRGIDILDSEPQMTAYIFAFGKMHQAKLNYAFDKLSDNFFEQEEINIIDYGCGQAIGTMCYADFLRKNHYSQKVKTITLIEPSEICLKRAALHTSVFFPDTEIKTVNKKFDDLTNNNIVCDEKTPTLHILSNVLDILNFDIYNFAELIKTNLKGKNQFVCVAPYYNGNEKDNRMDLFTSKINGSNIITRKYKANEFMPEKEWTCKISCFQKNYDSFGKIGNSDLEIPISEGIEPHTIYYEAAKKLDEYRIKQNAISHDFANGNGKIKLKDKVSVIEMGTFKHCYDLMAIIIPNSVTNIGESAFYGCSGLTSIVIPDSVTEIGKFAFEGCSALASINIPNSVTSIEHNAYRNCKSLTSIIVAQGNGKYDSRDNCNAIIETATNTLVVGCKNTIIPDSVTGIGNFAFEGCSGLTSINIPDSVTSIGNGAFKGCSGLTSINIPDSVTSIGNGAFKGCSGLTSIVVTQGNGKYDSRDNCNAIIETATNTLVCGCMNTTIPDSVMGIGKFAFEGCSALTSINIPNSVTSIEHNAYRNCKSLTSIIVAQGNGKYDSRNNCNAIIETATNTLVTGCMNTVIPDSVTKIGSWAFSGCSGLTSINIPDSVTKIGEGAFSGCSGLTSINIPDSVTEIGGYAFSDCYGLTSVTIPNSVTSIDKDAFSNCNSLEAIIIPKGTKEKFEGLLGKDLWDKLIERDDSHIIYYEATEKMDTGRWVNDNSISHEFANGKGKIRLKDNVKGIGDFAFYKCSGLTSINIPDSVTIIGYDAFRGCSGLARPVYNANCFAYFPNGYATKYAIPDGIQQIAGYAFGECDGLTSINIPDSVREIGESAFANCCGLTTINIPASMTKIGKGVFGVCIGLTSINIPDSVKEIGESAFAGCSGLTSVSIPNSVTNIGEYAFGVCIGLTSINIPDSVKEIGERAFAGCSGLTSINIPDSVTKIDYCTFEGCSELTSINIPDSVKEIGEGAFSGCSGLTSVTIGNSVTNIGENAFRGCCGLTSVTISNSVTIISERAFYGCRGLTMVTIGISVTKIGENAFYGCRGLTSVTIPNSVMSIGNDAFEGCKSLKEIIIPKGTREKFEKLLPEYKDKLVER